MNRSHGIKKRLVALLVVAFVAVASLAVPQTAHALTVSKAGFANVPADTVHINYPLDMANAQFSTTQSHFKRESGGPWTGSTAQVVYSGASRSGTLPGSFTLTWRNAGTDSSGASIDVQLTFSNIYLWNSVSRTTIVDFGPADGLTMDANACPTRMDVTIRVFKAGTSTPASGTALLAFADIDIGPASGSSAWPRVAEAVTLLSGTGSTVWMLPESTVAVSNNGTSFSATKSDPNNSYVSGFVTTMSTSGTTLRWQGDACGTQLLAPFMVNNQQITASSGTGGSISSPGVTKMRWKNNKTYTFTPATGYHLASLTVDGKRVTPTGNTYTFTGVTSNHTIHVEWARNTYTVKWVDGVTNEVLKTETVTHGGNSSAPSHKGHTGYHFVRWNGDGNNITADRTITSVCERNSYTVTFKDGITGETLKTQTVLYGDDATAPAHKEHTGYHFVRWDRGFTNITSNITVTSVCELNTYTVTYHDAPHGEPQGTPVSQQTVTHGRDAKPPQGPGKDGYEFVGWGDDGKTITSNRDIYPVFRPVLDVEVTPVQTGTVEATAGLVGWEPATYEITNNSKVSVDLVSVESQSWDMKVFPSVFTHVGGTSFAAGAQVRGQVNDSISGVDSIKPGETVRFTVPANGFGLFESITDDDALAHILLRTYDTEDGHMSAFDLELTFEQSQTTPPPGRGIGI